MRLVIIGDSSFTDKYAGLIRDLAATDKRIIFTGWQTGDRLWTLIQRARALVSASEDEGMPLRFWKQ
jgi:glycosyltransferase involved in cell wall biosynthesis